MDPTDLIPADARSGVGRARYAPGLIRQDAIDPCDMSKRAEGELSRQSEARYRGLLEAAPDAMVVVNQAGGIQLVQPDIQSRSRVQPDPQRVFPRHGGFGVVR